MEPSGFVTRSEPSSQSVDMSLAMTRYARNARGAPWRTNPGQALLPIHFGEGVRTVFYHPRRDSVVKTSIPTARLLTLPAELRLEIYDHLLVPGDVLVRHSRHATEYDVRFPSPLTEVVKYNDRDRWRWQPDSHTWQKKAPKAETQLFLVCKSVRDEAMQHFLATNTFVMMGVDFKLPYMSWGVYPPRDTHIRHLSIAFDRRACNMERLLSALDTTRSQWQQTHPSANGDAEWRTYVHDELEWELLNLR